MLKSTLLVGVVLGAITVVCLAEEKVALEANALDAGAVKLTEAERKKRAIVGCGGVLTAPTGIIYTKNYPDDYPAYTSCTWRISVPWPYTKIRLEFVPKIELEEISILGCFDVVTHYCINSCFTPSLISVYDGSSSSSPRHSAWCGKGTVPIIHSTGRHMYISFRSDGSSHHRGFLAAYTALTRSGTTSCA